MRRAAATALLALLAAGAAQAAKPLLPADGPGDLAAQTTEQWRSRGIPVCVARLRDIRALTPDDLEAICGCTFDSYLEGHGPSPLPGLENDRIPVALEHQLLACTSRTRPDQRTAVRELGTIWPRGAPPILEGGRPQDPKLGEQPGEAPAAESRESGGSGGGFWDWISNITLPTWLTGASILWWVAIGIFLLGLLILRIRRHDPRNDLVSPPSHMRRGAPPQPPRRPDLPR